MTLYQIVNTLKAIALSQPNIRSASDGSVYEAMDAKNSVTYDVFHITQTTHSEDLETDYYGLTLFYISRLEDSLEDNRLQAQSIGKSILSNIIRSFCENWSIDFPTITYVPFTQKFADLTAGVYCNIRLEIPKGIWCADDYISEVVPGKNIKLQDLGITITQNGLTVVTPDAEYDGIGEIRIVTDVPQSSAVLQYKEVEYTENGDYVIRPDLDYDGLSEVSVSVDVPSRYNEGYADGEADQKAKLSSTSFTQNSAYTRTDGWSSVTVDVPSRYDEGYADGEATQKAKLTVTSFTENNTYTREDGWSAVTVDVPSRYNEGYTDGEAAQKAKLSSTSVTENGTYTREDGYSAITVDVDTVNNQSKTYTFTKNNTQITQSAGGDYYLYGGEIIEPDSGYTGLDKATISLQANITDLYNSGYSAGFAAGASACSGYFITALTLNVDSAITGTTTATTTCSPAVSISDIYYTSSNPSIAAIDSSTGVITVLGSGTVTICAKDRFTNLQDCKSVTVSPDFNTLPLTFQTLTGGNITFKHSKNMSSKTIQYKKNNGNWTNITSSTGGTSISTVEGDIVQFRGNNSSYFEYIVIPGSGTTEGWAGLYGSQGRFNIYGNMMSLINSSSYSTLMSFSENNAFRYFFKDNGSIVSAQNLKLPATTLTSMCYGQLFSGCTSLTTAPSTLPATRLQPSCYFGMFENCTAMTAAPSLPATTLAGGCYQAMFNHCHSLANAPTLPATTLAEGCYIRMFQDCRAITSVPTTYLSATTLATNCYQGMFANCYNLTAAPHLTVKTLVEGCYQSMFDNCNSLSSITCLATNISALNCTVGWVYGVAENGTFKKASTMTSWTTGQSGIPSGWTIIDNS